ncbi:MAG TPA: HXXEE domain-containing protein [Longimicrobium sp.]|nr:HXXEE domain-containing protein [Longimicrobium sp.]
MKLRAFILLTPLVFLVHDAEEVATVARWTREHGDVIPALARGLLPIDTRQFAAAVALLFVILSVVSFLAARKPEGIAIRVWLVLLAALTANGITHPAQALVVGGYVPGVVTAVLVVIPLGVLAWRRALIDGVTSRRAILPLFLAGLAIQLPIVVLALLFGRGAG